MGNLMDVLRIGGNALGASQVAAQVVGNNISNSQVPSYHRQDTVFTSMQGLGGVRDVRVHRSANQLLESQLNAQRSSSGYAQARADGLALMVSAVGNFEEEGINASMTNLFNSWRQLSAQPEDISVRSDVLQKGQMFVERVQDASAHLTASQKLADDRIISSLSTVNDYLAQVASLNVAVKAAETSGVGASPLQDQRDEVIGQLASLIGATTIQQTDGAISVYMGGIGVVSGEVSYPLVASRDVVTGFHHLSVKNTTQGVVDDRITQGALGAQLALRDKDFKSAQDQLDAFAMDIVAAINGVHEAGYGLDGVTGRPFFAPLASLSGAASQLRMEATVATNPQAVAAAATEATAKGGNAQALAITDLEKEAVAAANTQTLGASLTQLISYSGRSLSDARAQGDQAKAFMSQTQNLWEQQHGVSLDEQMLQLSRIQNAHQAAAKLITTVDEMLRLLQNI